MESAINRNSEALQSAQVRLHKINEKHLHSMDTVSVGVLVTVLASSAQCCWANSATGGNICTHVIVLTTDLTQPINEYPVFSS